MENFINWFTNELPPLLQLMVGMFIALGTFKLLSIAVDRIKGKQDTPEEEEKKKED